MITKNSVVKIQNLAVNHESRPIKSNPVFFIKNVETSGNFLYHEIVCLGLYIIFVFDRDSWFWEKRTIMFECSLISQ